MKMLYTLILTTLLLSYTTSVSSEEECNDTEISESSQPPDQQDSRVEHVNVKQRTGFDGRVRSIRFGIDSEDSNNNNTIKRQPQSQNETTDVDTTESALSLTKVELDSSDVDGLSNNKELETTGEATETTLANDSPYETSTPSIEPTNVPRRRRSINAAKNSLNDLQAEEAKVFRPLFVYRQQVNKRMKLQREKSGISGRGNQRGKSSSHRYYHPYRYSPYRYYPSG